MVTIDIYDLLLESAGFRCDRLGITKQMIDEIFNLLDDFSSKDALKTKKYKCMKRLEKLVKDKFTTDNIL